MPRTGLNFSRFNWYDIFDTYKRRFLVNNGHCYRQSPPKLLPAAFASAAAAVATAAAVTAETSETATAEKVIAAATAMATTALLMAGWIGFLKTQCFQDGDDYRANDGENPHRTYHDAHDDQNHDKPVSPIQTAIFLL